MPFLTKTEKIELLTIARNAIKAKISNEAEIGLESVSPKLLEKGAAFVTLKIDKRLRGCIGWVEAVYPLAETVKNCAISAAMEDPRFQPLTADEYKRIEIEISVMTPLKKIDNVEEIEVGRDGLMITLGQNRGLLLPQVATEQKWDRETFLDQTCIKAGLSPADWKNPQAEISTFEAEIFSEEELMKK